MRLGAFVFGLYLILGCLDLRLPCLVCDLDLRLPCYLVALLPCCLVALF